MPGSIMQIAIGTMFTAAFLMVQLQAQPYKTDSVSSSSSWLLTLTLVGHASGFGVTPLVTPCACRSPRAVSAAMKVWEKRKTLADDTGGASDKGFSSVGLEGTIPVTFTQGNVTLSTMAMQGQKLSQVAAQSGQFIKYKCGKGECGTCEVRVDGQWIRTCSVKVPYVPKGETYEVFVRDSMKKSKKATRFFSFKSFISGAKNNIIGMFGFVTEGRKSKKAFDERLDREAEVLALAAAKKAARLAKDKEGK